MKTDNKTDTAPLAGSSSSTKPYNQQTKEYLARNPINVLVVDDDVVCLSLVSNLLKKWNYRVTRAKDAFDALRTLRLNEGVEFDLVITDVHMPEMDGFALHDQIRTEFGDLPVLFMSVDREDEMVAKGLMTGGLAYLQKPVNDSDLRDLWQYVLSTKNNSTKFKSGCHIIVPDIKNNTEKRTIISKNIINIERLESALKNINHSNDHVNNDPSNKDSNRSSTDGEIKRKENKMIWTTHLRNRFEEALRALGEKAVPRYILEFMNIPGLTREQVASHLQKYRLHLKRPVQDKKNVKKQLSLFSKSHNSLKFDDAGQRQMSSSSFYQSRSSCTVARSSSDLANLSSLNHQAPVTDLRNSVIAGVNSLLTMCEQQQEGAPTPFLNEGTSNTSTSNWRNCKSTTSILDLIFSRKPGDPSDLSSLILHGSNRHWAFDHQQNKQVDSNLSSTSTGLSHAGDLIPINGQYHPTDKQQIVVGIDPPNLGESSSSTGCGSHVHQDLIRNIENLLMTDEPHQPDNMTLDIDETLIANNSYSPVGHSIRGGVRSQWEIGESSRHGNSNPSASYPSSGGVFEDDNLLASLFATEENLPSESCNKEIE